MSSRADVLEATDVDETILYQYGGGTKLQQTVPFYEAFSPLLDA
jgi:hypothetical protein